MLTIQGLHARAGEREVLKGIDLVLKPGEVHAIMGPNGSGKTTLANVLVGREGIEVTAGRVVYCGEDLLTLEIEQRARAGIFLAMQYPVEIPGVSNIYFLKAAVNAVRKHRGQDELDAVDFLDLIKERSASGSLDTSLTQRNVNEGFSGGEKKRNEIFQMTMLDPRLVILDEIDSGLDIDALKTVATGINSLRAPDRSMLLVTHYERLLEYVVPDRVHVLLDGRIVRSGDKSLARELEDKGYGWVEGLAAC